MRKSSKGSRNVSNLNKFSLSLLLALFLSLRLSLSPRSQMGKYFKLVVIEEIK